MPSVKVTIEIHAAHTDDARVAEIKASAEKVVNDLRKQFVVPEKQVGVRCNVDESFDGRLDGAS